MFIRVIDRRRHQPRSYSNCTHSGVRLAGAHNSLLVRCAISRSTGFRSRLGEGHWEFVSLEDSLLNNIVGNLRHQAVDGVLYLRYSSPNGVSATSGITRGGQTYETADARVRGTVEILDVSAGLDIQGTEAALHSFLLVSYNISLKS